ncbi:RlmE family RNA methyltransferase [Candidatus Symbiobacter mobilis]|uniref:Ribosomal RNA large subunit methyltransferase E n=1 Tax=Candidatus Symbiobacter mobilis CR TaxID=946483 RepID=U5N5D1_9BURK|nr:RlmE family RNA methyltransferase [Candidatus Symbiobacter mobilis]AGX86726.1 large subunit rRNA methyltransferase E [Candidatus Symbiobacter mobilis CR]
MSTKKGQRAWFQSHVHDPYVRRAQEQDYRARSAFKLQEIDEKLHLFRPGQCVVDLGAAPGAWSQYVRRRWAAMPGAGRNSLLIALDLLPMEQIDGVHILRGDIRDDAIRTEFDALLSGRQVDVVLSDMAPNLSGIDSVDSARVEELVETVVDVASAWLHPAGSVVAKTFHAGSYAALDQLFRQTFRTVRRFKPQASRTQSSETYLLGAGLRGG